MSAAAQLLFVLLIAHAVCDYPLQGDFMARNKSRHVSADWWILLGAHALIHAGGVWAAMAFLGVAQAVAFAWVELVLHWWIDWGKNEGFTTLATDQLLHVACKVIYVLFLFLGTL